jgi:antitoxin CptB
MTGSTISSQDLDARRRRILFRAWHRGTREMDLIMGRFADKHIAGFSDAELDEFEQLIDAPDPELLAWVMGSSAPPRSLDSATFRRLREFNMRNDK